MQRKEEIELLLRNLDILVCVESWLTPKKDIQFSGFNVFRKDRIHSAGGGIIIIIRKSIAFSEVNLLTPPNCLVEICAIKITNINPLLEIIACYRVPGLFLSQDQWEQITDNFGLRDNCIVMGDFNAHHTTWNCPNSDLNGERLLQSIINNNLFLHNLNSLTHIDFYRNKKSNIDLILSSMNIADKIMIETHDETLGSDHYPISINIGVE